MNKTITIAKFWKGFVINSIFLISTTLTPSLIYGQVQGPGLGNLQYNPDELFKNIWLYVDPTHMGSNAVTMVNGYLVMTFTPDSGKPPGGLLVFDVSNPRKPILIKRIMDDRTSTLRECHAIGQHEKFIAIQDGCGIQIWDFQDALNPTLVKRFCIDGYSHDDYGSAWQIFWQAPYIFIGNGSQGLDVVDASDIKNPVFVKHVTVGMQAGPIFAVGNLLITTAHDNGRGFALLDISNPRDPKLINTNPGTESFYAASVNGNRVITSARGNSNNSTFSVHDISDPTNIRLAGRLDIGNSDDQLYNATQDQYIFQGCQREIVKIDATNVANMKITGRGSLAIGGDSDHGQVTPIGNLVFVGNDHGSGNGFIVHQTSPDTRGPEVNMINPSGNSVSRALTTRIGITCTDNIDISTINSQTFIVRPIGGQAIAGRYSHQTMIVNFSPSQPLLPNTSYEIFLPKGGIKDWAGNGIGNDFKSYFSTGPTGQFGPEKASGLSVTEHYQKVDLSWDKGLATKMVIQRSNSLDGPFNTVGNSSTSVYTDLGVENGVTYYYRVIGENSFGVSPPSAVLKAIPNFYITDLTWASATNGYGPAEIDQSNGEDEADDGRLIVLKGQPYNRGLGTHAPAEIVYNLNGTFKRFISDIGIDDEIGDAGSVTFKVFLDGKEVYSSGVMTGNTPTKTIDLDILAAKQLKLVVLDNGDKGSDHASWGGAFLISTNPVTSMNEERQNFNEIIVSPNPTINRINIFSVEQISHISITDMVGSVLYENGDAFIGEKSIDLSGYNSGVYLISIRKDTKVDVRKLVVE
ncbi:MAG TPA: NPCBM/NEW2 domain-containing protein [Cytophagaceae bacterium]|jgi:hypothetical protein